MDATASVPHPWAMSSTTDETGRATPATAPLPPPSLDGELRFGEPTRIGRADDFGHLVHQTPAGVLLPGSADDVAEDDPMERRAGLQVRPAGPAATRPSAARRSRAASWPTCRRSGTSGPSRTTGWSSRPARSGATCSARRLAQGRTPPVLTDYLELSVGGTLAVGGVGGTTSAFGVQSDNVIEMDVVTGTGEHVTCSPSDQRRPVQRGARGARSGGGHHPGDARARRGAGVGAPVPAVLPGPGDDAEGRAAAVRRRQVRRGAGRDPADAERRHRLPAGRGEELRRATRRTTTLLLAGLSDDPALREPATLDVLRLSQPPLRARGGGCAPTGSGRSRTRG